MSIVVKIIKNLIADFILNFQFGFLFFLIFIIGHKTNLVTEIFNTQPLIAYVFAVVSTILLLCFVSVPIWRKQNRRVTRAKSLSHFFALVMMLWVIVAFRLIIDFNSNEASIYLITEIEKIVEKLHQDTLTMMTLIAILLAIGYFIITVIIAFPITELIARIRQNAFNDASESRLENFTVVSTVTAAALWFFFPKNEIFEPLTFIFGAILAWEKVFFQNVQKDESESS